MVHLYKGEIDMDITQRQITKIAREAGKFISQTIKEEGVGTAEMVPLSRTKF